MVKGLAGLAVLVASAVPLVALAGTAGAATAPTLACSVASTAANPVCTNGYAIAGQGFSGNFEAAGTGFANDQAVGGNVTLTTTATGVTFSNIVEGATTVTATINTTSATPTGFYPVTLTDDSGTAVFAVGLGIDNGPQITTIGGNVGTAGASSSTVTITGTGLAGATPLVTAADASHPAVSAIVSNNAGTSLSFNVSNAGATVGTDTLTVSGLQGGESATEAGVATSSYTVNAGVTAISITAVTPNELGIPLVNPSSSTVTISGTGFELGAVLTITSVPPDAAVTVSTPTFVNSTTMTALITVGTAATHDELTVAVVNPDTTSVSGTGLIGIGVPAVSTAAGPAAPVAPALGLVSGVLAPGTASIIHVTGTSSFPITTGSTVNVKRTGVTNVSESLTGTVVSVDSTNTATIKVQVPRYATSVTTAALVVGATSLTVTDASGIPNGAGTVATIVDGTSTEKVTGTLTGNVLSGITKAVGAGTQFAHAAGVTVEFAFPATVAPGSTANVLTVNNGANAEIAAVGIQQTADSPPYPFSTYTATSTGAVVGTLDPGTYSVNAYLPGFGFATGSAVTFQSFTGPLAPTPGTPDNDGVTGTVTVVNGNTATLAITVPKIRSGDTGDWLTASATPGQNAITLDSVVNSSVVGTPNILVGDSLTINADSFFTTPETVTVTSVNTTTHVVGITPALADSHTGNATQAAAAEVIDNSDPQSINDRVQATITNGAGAVEVNPSFFNFTTGGTITSTQLATANTVAGGIGVTPFGASNEAGAGASGATINLALSQATDGSAPADWTGSSTNAGVTFGAITNDTGSNITTTINVKAGTAAAASVPISFTDGLETYTGTIAIVAGPTVSAVTTVGNLTSATTTLVIGVTGTNFVPGEMTCSTSDPAVGCAVTPEITDTSTTATVTLTPGAAMLNGSDSLTLTYSGGAAASYGAGTLAAAFTVSGQPVITAIAPAVVPAGSAVMPSVATPLVVTGTAFATAGLVCTLVATHPNPATPTTAGTCSVTSVNATTIDITAFTYAGYTTFSGGDSVVFTIGTSTSTANTPAVSIQTDPVPSFMVSGSVLQDYTHDGNIAQGSAAVPFYIIGAGYLAGAVVTFSTFPTGGTAATATVTSVTPNGVYGTVTVPSTATVDPEDALVTNVNGGAGVVSPGHAFSVVAAPGPITPTALLPKAILDGVPTTITISGSGFITGAVVSGAVTGVDTFGPATVSNSANPLDKCTGLLGDTCNTIKVLVTPVNFAGSTPILDGLVITNPVGGGSVTTINDITVNPVPAVTGVYYVPTFTANREITITGTGFESGITATSANPDYTVLAVASTSTTVTLLVTTDSNATAGTSSTVTLTNPDTGAGTFTLNGGPNPALATPTPKATAAHGVAHLGKRSKVTISGTHFYGQPKVTSNNPGVKVATAGDSGKTLTLWITSKKTSKKGVHTLTIRFKNGESTHVKYNTTK
jgi:hypothetical protein